MRKSRRLVVPLAVTALVAGGGIGFGLALAANAQTTITSCSASGTATTINCSIGDSSVDTTVNAPASIEAVVNLTTPDGLSTDDQYVNITYSVDCFQGSGEEQTSEPTDDNYAINTSAAVTDSFTLGYTNPDSCEVLSVEAVLESSSDGGTTFDTTTTGAFTMSLEWTPAASSTTTATTSSSSSVDVSYIGGYDSKCIDDRENGSSNGSQLIIWGCNHGDSAQGWTWTDYELRHDGMCANDPGYGGSGTKLILYSCNGGANEKWSHVSYGEFKLYFSGKGQLCLDDPGYSKTNGTRLSVYDCNNGSNQHWSRS